MVGNHIKCVFPGFDHAYYEMYINDTPDGDHTPWKNGNQDHGQWDLEHMAQQWHLT